MPRSRSSTDCPLRDSLRGIVERYGHEGLLLAISGGPDSMALLHALLSCATNQTQFQVAHLNHGLRGDASDQDAELVRQYCSNHDIPCVIEKFNATFWNKTGKGVEARARKLRYDWLIQQAEKLRCRYILTAHHADDQAETIIHHLLRGTGLRGLRGIAPRRKLPNSIVLLRPLLHVSREEIEKYIAQHDIHYCIDETNQDTRWTRNRIRHRLMPILKEINPAAVKHLCQSTVLFRRLQRETKKQALEWLVKCDKGKVNQMLVLDARLGKAPLHIFVEALQQLAERERWRILRMTHFHWKQLRKVFQGKLDHINLPDGLEAKRKLHVVQLGIK